MRILSLVMLLLLILAFAAFFSLNAGKVVDSISLGYRVFTNVQLNAVVAWAVGIGIVWALVIFITQEIRLRLRIARLKGSISRLQDELDQLRTMPIAEIGLDDKEEQ